MDVSMNSKPTLVGWPPYGNDRATRSPDLTNHPGNVTGYEMLATRTVPATAGFTPANLAEYDFAADSRFRAHRTTTRGQHLPTKPEVDTLSLSQGALEYIIKEVNSDAAVT